jgi:hypothetical protein
VPSEPKPETAHPSGAAPSRAEALGDEVEAVLAGTVVEYLVGTHRPVPSWAALNRVAHGGREQLVRVLATDCEVELDERGRKWERPWAESERKLAFRILSNTSDPVGLHDIQQSVLVPLEMALIEQCKVGPMAVHEVIQQASDTLDNHLTDR